MVPGGRVTDNAFYVRMFVTGCDRWGLDAVVNMLLDIGANPDIIAAFATTYRERYD